MYKLACTLSILLACLMTVPAAKAQLQVYGESNSYLTIDIGSGEVYSYAFTEVYAEGDEEQYYVDGYDAGVNTTLSDNTSGGTENTCGYGCSEVELYDQVYYLGQTWTEASSHWGRVYYFVCYGGTDCEGDYEWDYYDSTYGAFALPGYPSISLQSIDATNPHYVGFTYSIGGTVPYVTALGLGDELAIGGGGTSVTLHLDQAGYPSGSNNATFSAYVYGVPAPYSCTVNVGDSSPNDTGGAIVYAGGDPETGVPQYIFVSHIAADSVTSISSCITPVYGSRTTRIQSAHGSADTSGVDPNIDRDIAYITEQHSYPGGSDTLGPVNGPTYPEQGPLFQSRELSYSDLWIGSGSGVSICNTGFALQTNNGVLVTGPLGCIGLALP
jgi:hypothetical protein